ncbi:phosphoinositide 3-kinase regulatory subunit 4 isoform X2 [Ceratitis capitata]|uniref:phosphoinositide 3-kinase regulatory subunit 4 isoform X2 n=1 Tax=Ceratitis capitata TaxID=7213 RepID=UPI00061896E8|nr:phosphoinositide 3-kinase regulatory subunit 4 isoform X2 [Ceratitis capitata]
MGNQLVGIAPSQIYPMEHYFSGTEIVFESNMGSTRFFKVAKAKSEEGLIVVKVFVRHDPTLPLECHKERLEYIKKALANAVNCLPFQRVDLTDKAAYIMREFVKHNLYDRLSTRPFLTTLEKKWITFQILCALNQCHKQKICHGDIKLENILINSWNWVLLSDFASFKPTYLPDDNPADYTYFFDTSRRRTCYIAPERFVKSSTSDDAVEDHVTVRPTDSLARLGPFISDNTLTPAMDIFSAGCTILELWNDGTAPFELSQLLSYRGGDTEIVNKHLDNIENDNLRSLLASMINLHPKNRKSAEDYLDQERGRLFPEYFYSFLQSYLQMFSSLPIMTPDDKILRLHSDIGHCIKVLTNDPNLTPDEDEEVEAEQAETKQVSCERLPPDQDGLILIITVVTSSIRGLRQTNTKICSLEILHRICKYTTSDTILDRILPYILYLAHNSTAKVQVQSIETLTACLNMVKHVPLSDANIFPEYILPAIAKLSCEPSAVIVRMAFARNVAKIAKIAIYFLEETQRNAPHDMPARRYDTEVNVLHEFLQRNVLSLLTDSRPIVKQTLMESSICDLCGFFGKEKANDIILSHIMTFLNDEDKNLRGSFFDNIAGVAGYVGWQASDILVPLLLQGFTDREEFVISKAIRAITTLIELGHIKKPAITDIIKETACYLCHPNLWIRHEICGMISTAARILNAIDVQVKIMPSIKAFLKMQLIQVEKPYLLLDCLLPPIPQQIYDSVLRFQDTNSFITELENRAAARSIGRPVLPTQHDESNQALRNLFCRLSSEGLNEIVEMQLLAFKPYIFKLKHKAHQDIEEPTTSGNGRIVITRKDVLCHEFPLSEKLPRSPQESQRSAECRKDLEALRVTLKNRYSMLAYSQQSHTERLNTAYPQGWSMNGTMIAHLHEHSESVSKMASLRPYGPIFASGSVDGTVRLWDCNKLNGSQAINKSRQVYSANTPIYSLVACDGGQSLAVGGKDGSLLIMRIDRNSSKMTLQQALHLDECENSDGPVVDMQSYDQSVIIYATVYGAIVGWDTRVQKPVWRLENELQHGVITTICVDSAGSWLATGTSGGKHICWDLRFRLPIAEIKHPSGSRIRKVACHPTEPSYLISAYQANNEVSLWNIETGHRQTVLWASQTPLLSNTQTSETATSCGILSGIVNNSPFLLTGSSDQRIRYWDLNEPKNSALKVPAIKDNLDDISFTYDSQIIDGSQVIFEQKMKLNNTSDINSPSCSMEENPRSGPDMPSTSHHDAITDLLMCKSDKGQIYIASAARDGVIKLWK